VKRRIEFWVLAGLAVAAGWVLFGMLRGGNGPGPNLAVWPIVLITAPAALLARTRIPIAYYWFILANGAVYGLAGMAIEVLLREVRWLRVRLHS
jgi:hypothetical protein